MSREESSSGSGRGEPGYHYQHIYSRRDRGSKRLKKSTPEPQERERGSYRVVEEEIRGRRRSPPEERRTYRQSEDTYRGRRRERSSSASGDDRRSRRQSEVTHRKRRERSSSGSDEGRRSRRQWEDAARSRRYEGTSSERYDERRAYRYTQELYRRREPYHADTRDRRSYRHVEDPYRHVGDPYRHVEDPYRHVEDPYRHVEDPYGHVEDPYRHVEDPYQVVEDPYRSRRRGSRPDTGDESRRQDPEQPGPSWSGQGGQAPPRFQQQQQQQQHQPQPQPQPQPPMMYQSQPPMMYQPQPPMMYQPQPPMMYQQQPQQYQSRPQQPPQSWEQEEAGDFNARMSGLNVEAREEEESWGQVTRRPGRMGGAWGQPQRPSQVQPQPTSQQQRAWPRPPQTQSRPQPRQESQMMPQPRHEQQVASKAAGAWAKGPPQDLQKLPQERPSRPAPETATQPKPEGTQPKPKGTQPHPEGSHPQPDQPRQQEESKSKKRPENRCYPETFQSSDFMDFAPRIYAPQKTGRAIEVYANFFQLRLENYDITVFHYDVVFEPDVPKGLVRKAWNKVSEVHFPKRITVFDGMSNVYSKGPLVNGSTFRGELALFLPDSGRTKEYTMMIKEVRRIPMNTLTNYRERIRKSQTIEARKKALPLAEVSVIEVILKNWPANNLIQHNRVFFPKTEMQPRSCNLSDRLELRYGYFQSAFLGHKLYLNFDVAHRPFYKDDYIRNLVRDLSQGRIRGDYEEANHYLKGAKIEYTVPDERKKISYRANKLVGTANSQSFEKDGRCMTVAEYFSTEKQFRLRFPNLPLLWVGPTTKTIYLPLELVKLAEDQIYKGALNPVETRKMVAGATTDARRRKTETVAAFTRANFHDNPYLKEFGISVSREMETVKARVLEPPKLKTNTVITVKEGAWKTRAFLDPKSFNRWCIVNLDKTVDRNSLVNLQKSLQAKAREFNMQIGEPTASIKDHGGVISYFELQRIFSNLKGMTIVIVVIADTKGLYSKVKTICETQEGILTQCIRGKNITSDPRKIMTTLDNLLLKVNAKLGGTNHTLNKTSFPPCLEGYSMVVGADVTHAGPGSKIPSVAAVAACCEVSAFQYGITIRVQTGEIIQDLKDVMRINLQNFHAIRNRFPDKIFFFRDGVSEGEMEKVLKTEFRAIRESCESLGCSAKITLLVVQKRHHTRFFPTSVSDEEGKTFNVPVGTCVDSDVVHPGGLDFYLLSHGSLLGTARPTRYRLLHDDNRLTDDELEQLTFYLCHLYSRCNRSVSYPSPTYNAHLAAFRARAYLEGLNLTDKDDLKQVQGKLKDAISATFPMFFV